MAPPGFLKVICSFDLGIQDPGIQETGSNGIFESGGGAGEPENHQNPPGLRNAPTAGS